MENPSIKHEGNIDANFHSRWVVVGFNRRYLPTSNIFRPDIKIIGV